MYIKKTRKLYQPCFYPYTYTRKEACNKVGTNQKRERKKEKQKSEALFVVTTETVELSRDSNAPEI